MPMVELLVFLIAIFFIATPIIALILLVRYTKLRSEFNQLKEENARQHTSFQRELADLKRQPAGAVQPAAPAAEKPLERPVVAPAPATTTVREAPVPAPRVDLPAPVKLPPPVPLSTPPAQPPLTPASPPTQKPPAPSVPPVPKPEIPAAAKPPAEIRPSAPAAPPFATPPAPPSIPSSPSRAAPPPPPPPAKIPPVAAARVTTTPPTSAFRVPAPKPTFQQRMKTVSAIEDILGTNWFAKLGGIMIVIGVAIIGAIKLANLGPAGKVFISYLVAGALLGGGVFLEKRERYQLLGRVGIGCGWALLFFSTYAIHNIAAMRVLDSTVLDCILMLAVALGMAAHTLRYKSQYVTGVAFLLGYTTVALSFSDVQPLSSAGTSDSTVYGLLAGVILAIGLVAIIVKMGWFELEVFGILSSYLNHLYWLYRLLGNDGAHGHPFPEYHASLAILLFYWLTFRISYIVRSVKTDFEEHISTLAALLNVLLLLGVMKFQSVQPELAYLALLVIGALEFIFAQLSVTRRRRQAFVVLSVVGAILMLAAVPFHYSGNNVAILWLVGAEAFLLAGVIVKEVVFRRLGLLTGLLVGVHLVGIDFRALVNLRLANENLALASGILFALCSTVFYLNALAAGLRWKEFFGDSPDRPLLTLHSYLGAFAGGSAVWALFSDDWTALAFAAVMLILAAIGRALDSKHLQVQYALLGALTLYRAVVINLHIESPEHVHLSMRLLTLPLLGAAFYITAKLAALRDDPMQRALRGLFAAAGTALFALLIWFEVPELWQPLAFIAFAVLLSEAARALNYYSISAHSHALSCLAVFTALTANKVAPQYWRTIPLHVFAAIPVVAGAYWLAGRLGTENERHLSLARVAYTWVAAGLIAWMIEEALALYAPWIAVGWIVFAVVLALSTRWIRYQQLAWQANVVGFCALLRAFFYNYELEQKFWGPITLRVFTISLVAAGLYFLSRKAAPEDRFARPIAFFHSFAATGLLALLAWYEAPNGWLAPLWATFALVLAIVDQRFELEELTWQSHALAGLTLVRSITVNLYVVATWHGLSVRLLSLAIVAVIFYALSRLIRMPEEWRRRDLHHIYSWAASVIVSLLLWYELQPLSIAVGWAVFGLVLFEYGVLRKIAQFRYQAYIALLAAFTRIFFANLTAGEPGEFWGPRMYTILPLVLIFFFVYAQLPEKEENLARDRRMHFDVLLAYLGTASIVALFYFQFSLEWVVTAWAAVVFALLGAALLLDRPVFLHQGLLLTVGVFARGMVHNLFGGSYYGAGNWTGRYFVLSSAAAILLASLFFAFRLRDHFKPAPNSSRLARFLAVIVRRPEQLEFFVPVILITCMLYLKMREGMVTVSWGVEGVLIIVLAIALGERSFMLTGFGTLVLCVGKVFAIDIWRQEGIERGITIVVVGVALLAASLLYIYRRDHFRKFL